uniref:Fibrinogen C-terminal domain-containing protein n=1 Tax=Globodera pallida TaxID=36090 RepID=A0A183CJH0_GLOPA
MNLLIINLLIALTAFAALGAHPWVRDPWSECKLETNGLFMLEKKCKNLQICYQSKLAGKLDIGSISKIGGRFGLKKRLNEKPPFFDCAVVMGGRGGWHGLNITRNDDGNSSTIQSSIGFNAELNDIFDPKSKRFTAAINISKDFWPLEKDFQNLLHLGAFMNDLDEMSLRILAMDILSSTGQNGTGLCKKKCGFGYQLAVIADLDKDSKVIGQKNEWKTFVRRGRLFYDPAAGVVQSDSSATSASTAAASATAATAATASATAATASATATAATAATASATATGVVQPSVKIEWLELETVTQNLSAKYSSKGRAMELSDLCIFDGHLLTVDDRTGFVYRMDNFTQMDPWVFLADGPGETANITKGFKGEWMTVRGNKLYVGGLGKEWTKPNGDWVNDNPMYVKVITPGGVVSHTDWTKKYKALRRKVGIEFPGYMIHG